VLPFVNGGSAESIISERHPQVVVERHQCTLGACLTSQVSTPFTRSALNYRAPAAQGLTEAAVIGIAYPVLQVLSFMHQLSLMHRDVKVCRHPKAPSLLHT
jgi:serine/threonine protein kinase